LGLVIVPISKRPTDGLSLRARGSRVDAATVTSLMPLLPYLVEVDLSGAEVDDGALASLAGFRQLEKLNLSGTGVSGQFIIAFASHPRLAILNLTDTRVNDVSLLALVRNSELRVVYTKGSAVTEDGRRQFKELNPSIRIP